MTGSDPTPATGSPVLAAVDIGTNSIHVVVARRRPDGGFATITTDKAMVRLGSGSGDMKRLDPEAVQRAVTALVRFGRMARGHGATVRAVATSAVREAEDREVLLARARAEAGIEIEVISGVEEARLIHLGVIQSVAVAGRRVLVFDIGGGSTEFVVADGAELLDARSLKLGAIRLTERFFPGGRTSPEAVEACRAHVRSYLVPVVRVAQQLGYELAIGSSGTTTNLAEVARLARADGPGDDRSVGAAELQAAVARVLAATEPAERGRIPGLDPRRADIVAGGATLLGTIVSELGIERLVVSDSALREGLLVDTAQREVDARHHRLGDIRSAGVRRLMALTPADELAHAERAAELALQLFDATAGHHHLDEEAREALEAAALLANVGLAISHTGHHVHSHYVIRNSEQLRGFTQGEVERIAQVARYHRKSLPKAKHEDFAALPPSEQAVVRTLAGILRVAIALDRTRSRAVAGVTARRDEQGLLISVTTSHDAAIELWTADERRELLEVALGLDVRFEARDEP